MPNSKEVINYSSFCGGTVINHRHVITAAHCIPIKIEYKGLSIPINSIQKTINFTYTIILLFKRHF